MCVCVCVCVCCGACMWLRRACSYSLHFRSLFNMLENTMKHEESPDSQHRCQNRHSHHCASTIAREPHCFSAPDGAEPVSLKDYCKHRSPRACPQPLTQQLRLLAPRLKRLVLSCARSSRLTLFCYSSPRSLSSRSSKCFLWLCFHAVTSSGVTCLQKDVKLS